MGRVVSDTVRAFVALPVGDDVVPALTGVQDSMRRRAEKYGLALRWTRPEQFHVTVKFLGDVETKRLAEVTEVIKWHASRTLPLNTRTTGLIAFGGPRRAGAIVVALDDEHGAIVDFATRLEEDVVPLGIEREKRLFRAHITLARVKERGNVAAVLDASPLDPMRLSLDEVRLYESRLGPSGGTYGVLARSPLGRT